MESLKPAILNQSYSYGDSTLQQDSWTLPQKIYLFGAPLSHSLSPLINSILFKYAKAAWTYNLSETTNREQFRDTLIQANCVGASITMPNKVAFMPLLDELTEEAKAIGAVNTVFIRSGSRGQRRYIGSNTDCVGVREALLNKDPELAQHTEGYPALVIGAGGASRSAIYALWKWFRPAVIYLVNRLESEVVDLISSMEKSVPGVKLMHVETVGDVPNLPAPRVVVGTVPDGLPTGPEELRAWQICESFLQNGQRRGVVLDMCYHPIRTRLLGFAETNGWTTVPGTEVLVRVNVAQNTLWLEKEPSEVAILEALQATQGAPKI